MTTRLLWALLPAVLVALVAVLVALTPPQRELDWGGAILPMVRTYAHKLNNNNTDQYEEDRNNSTQSQQPSSHDSPASIDPETPLTGAVAVVTGATSGIGKSLTRALLRLGATVVALGRSPTKLQRLQQEEMSSSSTGRLVLVQADFNDLNAVAAAGREILQQFSRIDLLCNNAGAHDAFSNLLGTKQSAQGYDAIFAVNYLSHVLLTEQLAAALQQSQAPVILQVSSSYHWGVDGTELVPQAKQNDRNDNNNNAVWSPPLASQVGGSHGFLLFRSSRSYSNSKLAQILHARALKRHHPLLRAARIVSACPGWVRTQILEGNRWTEGLVQHGSYHSDGWGLASILLALFDDENDETSVESGGDFYVNSRFLHSSGFASLYKHLPKWAYAAGIRDVMTFVLAMTMLLLQRFSPDAMGLASAAESYNVETQDALYEWSLGAIGEFL